MCIRDRVVAGAKVIDEVTYGGLVPGKKYTLKAELINKADGKTVLGTGEATFTPDAAEGMEPVTITVNDDVEGPVEAAVAFEELTSVEVNGKGEETPGTDSEKPNHIADHKDINDKDQTVPKEEETTTSTEPCKPGDETTPAKPSEPSEETTEPTEPGEGTTEPGEPTGETTEPCEPGEPGTPTTEEITEPTEPTGETTKPGNETETSETTEPTEPTGETTKPGQPGEPGEPETPTTEEHKPGKPWVTTNADFAEGSHEVVAGAKVIDEVTYGGLVPGLSLIHI